MHVPLNRRTQLLLDERRYQRLRARAAAEGISVGAVIRSAIDRTLDEQDDSPAAAAASFLAAPPLPVGEPEDLTREFEESYERSAR